MRTTPTATVDRNLFGLTLTAPPDHPAVFLIRRLPRLMRIPPQDQRGEWIVALVPDILPMLRQIYRMEGVTFTPAAIEALRALSDEQRAVEADVAALARSRVEITPDVSASLRSLEPTLDPTARRVDGDSRRGTGPLSNAGEPSGTPP
jgi:hypothetical protein